jgi:TIR domain
MVPLSSEGGNLPMTTRTKVFVSYSHADKDVRDEVLRSLRAVPRINRVLWWDEEEIAISDKFHPKIQQGLAESRIGILLLSNYSFTSDYILRHELPYLIEHAEAGDLKLGCLYLTAMAEAAFIREIESNGQKRTINLKEYLGAHAPNAPLDRLDRGARAEVYKNLADWVAGVIDIPEDRQERQRYELGVTLREQRHQWEHSFWLPPATLLQRPQLKAPDPDELFGMPGDLIDGENLFRLLFGSDPHTSGNLFGAAFGIAPPADPTRAPLRLRLITNDARLWALPWGKIAYQGQRLAEVGWTVELHHTSGSGMPEYPVHTCYIPARCCCLAPRIISTPRKAWPILRM